MGYQHDPGLPVLQFERDICADLGAATSREWLVTNGLGGYAAGTIAGVLTRRYHGLLIAALRPPGERVLLLSKLDEVAAYHGQEYPLFTNHWPGGVVEPKGLIHLDRFWLLGSIPCWEYSLADALLQRQVWMQPGANTTYIRYSLVRASAPMRLSIRCLVTYRNHHVNTHARDDEPVIVGRVDSGLQITAGPRPLFLLSKQAEFTPHCVWYHNYYLAIEHYRGLDPLTDNCLAAQASLTLMPGQSVTLVASTEPIPDLDGDAAFETRRAYETRLLEQGGLAPDDSPEVRGLVLAADQFIARRHMPDGTQGYTVIAGYPWFADWGRDTMIALPGLTLATRRYEIAAGLLRTFAHFVDQGMLPNMFPRAGTAPQYNTVDAALWYVEAVRAYHAATGDDALLAELFPALCEIIDWHRRGTRYNIHADPADGLLYAGEEKLQLTWMDAKIGDWVVTPRIGKPVEINALWYNALASMAAFADHLSEPAGDYRRGAEQARFGFERFWNEEAGFCFDVLDGPAGSDSALRPNQLLAVSLHHSPLDQDRARRIVDACARHLYTPHGLRSLDPRHRNYAGTYGGDQVKRDSVYHQGTVWAWLMGPFVEAHLKVYGDPPAARSYLLPLLRHLTGGCVGSLGEIFDGDPPFIPRGAFAQAWSVAEVLRAWMLTRG
ncbi:MAG: amylo-alpha-1,6-glucosidase [Anaerolineae bacterium]